MQNRLVADSVRGGVAVCREISWDEDFFFAAFAALGILRSVKFQTISRSIAN